MQAGVFKGQKIMEKALAHKRLTEPVFVAAENQHNTATTRLREAETSAEVIVAATELLLSYQNLHPFYGDAKWNRKKWGNYIRKSPFFSI